MFIEGILLGIGFAIGLVLIAVVVFLLVLVGIEWFTYGEEKR